MTRCGGFTGPGSFSTMLETQHGKGAGNMDNIIVAVIMIGMIIAFVVGAIIAHKKGNSGFASAAKYDERVAKKARESRKR